MSTWFITGCSSGFGNEIAKTALADGHNVIATARDAKKLKDLETVGAYTLSLDITAPDTEIKKVVAQAVKKFGSISLLVNNAGYILEGAIEEANDKEAKAQFNTNIFGQLAVTRAVLPYMRERRSGVIANMGSIGGWHGGSGIRLYCSTIFALVGISESLRDEVKHMGIQVVCIEPGYFCTNFLSGGHRFVAQKSINDLQPVMVTRRKTLNQVDRQQPGDPVKGAKLIVEALTQSGRCKGKELPPRLALGKDAVDFMNIVLEKAKKTLHEWAELSVSTDHDQ